MKPCNEIIRELRQDRDLKQIEIATLLGTSQQYYSKYENGEFELPMRSLATLADYYNVSADYIMGRTKSSVSVGALEQNVTTDCTVGEMLSNVLSLDAEGRKAVIDYIGLQKMKQCCDKKK